MAKKMDVAGLQELADMFGLLGDPTRLKVVCQLGREPQNVTGLCKLLGANQPTMSHHLGLLRMGRVVLPRRNGKQVIYSLNVDRLSDMFGRFNSSVRGR